MKRRLHERNHMGNIVLLSARVLQQMSLVNGDPVTCGPPGV